MKSKIQINGHPVHPMLVTLPIGLLVTTALLDIYSYFSGRPEWWEASFLNLGLGILTGLVAAFVGWLDWNAISSQSRAKTIGAVHGLGNVVVLFLFSVAWYVRSKVDYHPPVRSAFVLELLALLCAGGTTWLGGELVYRFGVGVDSSLLNEHKSL